MLVSEEDAMDQAVRLSRHRDYPRDPVGLRGLVEGIMKACEVASVTPERIVDAAMTTSDRCPTDFVLLNIAKDIRGPETWKPEPIPPDTSSGWTAERRRIHDAMWEKFCADPKNRKMVGILKKHGAA